MIEIDGSQGEGGGQIIRTALTLSLSTGRTFRVFNVRAGRPRPGLLRQHLAAVQAAAEIGHADTRGAVLGSRDLTFRPGKVAAGDYRFAIGSAGSTTLVLQTILPVLLTTDRPSRLTLEGGTHNTFAPPFEFLEHTFLPLVNRLGPSVRVTLVRPGFYPAGGGQILATVEPCRRLSHLELCERGKVLDVRDARLSHDCRCRLPSASSMSSGGDYRLPLAGCRRSRRRARPVPATSSRSRSSRSA